MKKGKKTIQVSRPVRKLEEIELNGWINQNRDVVPFNKMTDSELLNAIVEAQVKELKYFNLCGMFSVLAEKMMAEAEKRNLEIRTYDREYTNNNMKARDKRKSDEKSSMGV